MVHIFIYNPETGDDGFSDRLREALDRRQKETDPEFQYFVFTTRYSGHEKEVVRFVLSMFSDEEIRIYCCGGSGTIRNVIAGMDDIGAVEIAFYPCGMTNDILKCFGENAESFSNLDLLIEGSAIKMDCIETNYGPSLNAVSFGLDSQMLMSIEKMRKMMDYLSLLKTIPYLTALIKAMFFMRKEEYLIEIDGISLDVKASEIVFSNGCAIGGQLFTAGVEIPIDGKATYDIVTLGRGRRFFRLLKALMSNERTVVKRLILTDKAVTMSARRRDGASFGVSFDGELEQVTELEMRLVPDALRFVVPKGVTVHEGL